MQEGNKLPFSFCLITDFRFICDKEIETVIDAALSGGVDIVQFRDPKSPRNVQVERARRVRLATKNRNVPLLINSDCGLMTEIDADGIQAKSGDILSIPSFRKQIGKGKLIGASVHTEKEIFLAERGKADFLMLSPLFSPGSKSGTVSCLGLKGFRELCSIATLPVIALGGINETNVHVPFEGGANGVSMVTGLFTGNGNVYVNAKKISRKINAALR